MMIIFSIYVPEGNLQWDICIYMMIDHLKFSIVKLNSTLKKFRKQTRINMMMANIK